MKKYFFYFFSIFLILKILVLNSCANIVPPMGGPRDTLPPVLVKAVPVDSALHFNANKIVLTFDEYVQLDNVLLQSIVTSPNPIQAPFIQSKLQTVTVRLKDSLQPNTTYSINFGKAIKDVNEGNAYKNFTYVFSTGNSIAKGALSGKVLMAETGTPDSTLIVILQKDLNDSAIRKERPFYYTNLDSGGNFSFKYIEHGKYNVFVLPNDYTKKYDDSTKTFAFLNEPVTFDSNALQPLMMYAYNQFPPSKSGGGAAGPVPNIPIAPKRKPIDTAKAITINTNIQKGEQDLLGNLILTLSKSIQKFDSSKISFSDTNFHSITNYKIAPDTSATKFTFQYPWKEAEYFKLVIQKDAFTDSTGKTLAKNDTISFKTSSESAYGSIRLRFSDLPLDKNPVLQLIQNNTIVDSVAMTGTEFYRKLYRPGDYNLRILFDNDKNMTWTPGDYDLKKQPEIVINIARKLTIKQNWDNEVNIQL